MLANTAPAVAPNSSAAQEQRPGSASPVCLSRPSPFLDAHCLPQGEAVAPQVVGFVSLLVAKVNHCCPALQNWRASEASWGVRPASSASSRASTDSPRLGLASHCANARPQARS